MTDAQKQFVERVDKSEKRYKGHKYATHFLMPRDLLIQIRDELTAPMLPEIGADAIDFLEALEIPINN